MSAPIELFEQALALGASIFAAQAAVRGKKAELALLDLELVRLHAEFKKATEALNESFICALPPPTGS